MYSLYPSQIEHMESAVHGMDCCANDRPWRDAWVENFLAGADDDNIAFPQWRAGVDKRVEH